VRKLNEVDFTVPEAHDGTVKNHMNFVGISPGCSVSQTPTWVIEALNVGKQAASYQSPDVLIEAC